MRTALIGALFAACLAALPITSKPADALPLTAPAGMAAAADALSETQKVSYYGWGYRPYRSYYGYRPWRPYYGYYRPYRPYYGYYRPYYRPVYYGYRPYYRPYYRPAYYGYRPWIRPAFYGPRFYGGWGYRRYW